MSDSENNGPVIEDQMAGGEPTAVKPAEVVGNGETTVGPAGDAADPVREEGEGEEGAEEESEEKEGGEEEAQGEDGEEEEEESEEELQPGLLERPVVLEAGRKRERKKTDRLETSFTTPGSKNVKVPEGSGAKLGEIENIEFMLRKARAEDLKPLHRVLYGRGGGATEVKKNIRKFCGFTFSADSPEYDKRQQAVNKFTTISMLKQMCEVLNLERGGTKDTLVERVLEYLLSPAPDGKPLKERAKRRSSSSKGPGSLKKRRRRRTKLEMEEARRIEAATGKPVKRPDTDESEEEDEEEEEERSDEEGGGGEESPAGDADDEAAAKKSKQTPKKTPSSSPTKPTKKAKESRKALEKAAATKADKKQKSGPKKRRRDSDDSSADEVVAKSKKKAPSDDELRELVKKILDGANLEEITMKTVCKQVYDKYPAFDLTPRKDFIKTTVKAIIK